MRRGKIWFAAAILPVLALGAAWYDEQRQCSYPAGPVFAPDEWIIHLWHRVSGQELDCDPWEYVGAEPLTEPLFIGATISSVGGSVSYSYHLAPDGGIAFYPDILWLETDPDTIPEFAFRFNDPEIYRLAVERLSALRGYSHSFPPSRDPLLPAGKTEIQCGDEGGHGAYGVSWDGDFGLEDYSYFEGGSVRSCPATRSVLTRLRDVTAAITARVPTGQWDEWYDLEKASRELWREENTE